MKFALWDHAGKGSHLRERLLAAGHSSAETVADADLMLLDCDWAWAHPRPALIQAAKAAGAKVALYPHGGLPTTFVYDGLTVPDENVDLRLEHGQASVDAAAALGLDLRQEATGWLYGATSPFAPVEDPVRVLFAPQHPNMEMLLNGTNGHDPGPLANNHVFRWLLAAGFKVTVSVVGPLWRNGIYPHPGVTLVSNHQMRYELSLPLIQDADVVVAAGTLAAAAVAAGKPTVMLGQGHYADYVDGQYVNPDHLEIYDDLFRYPLDANEGDFDNLVPAACDGNPAVEAWRARLIGDAGAGKAVELLEALVGLPSSADVTIEGEPQHVFIEGVTATAGAVALPPEE